MQDIHNHDEKQWGERTPLFNTRKDRKKEILSSLKVSGKSDIMKETLNSITEPHRETHVLQKRMNGIVRDRVKSLSDIKKEHGVLFLSVQSFVKKLVKVIQILLHIPPWPKTTLVPINETVKRVLYGSFDNASYDPVSRVTDREWSGVRDPPRVLFWEKMKNSVVKIIRRENPFHKLHNNPVKDRSSDSSNSPVNTKRDVVRSRSRGATLNNLLFNYLNRDFLRSDRDELSL